MKAKLMSGGGVLLISTIFFQKKGKGKCSRRKEKKTGLYTLDWNIGSKAANARVQA